MEYFYREIICEKLFIIIEKLLYEKINFFIVRNLGFLNVFV